MLSIHHTCHYSVCASGRPRASFPTHLPSEAISAIVQLIPVFRVGLNGKHFCLMSLQKYSGMYHCASMLHLKSA